MYYKPIGVLTTMFKNIPPLRHLHVFLSHDITSGCSLNHPDQSCQLLISHLLKSTQKTSFEEHLNVRKTSCQRLSFSIREVSGKYLIFDNNKQTLVCPNLYSS